MKADTLDLVVVVAVATFVLVVIIGVWRLRLSYRKTAIARQALQNVRLEKADRRIAELINQVDRLQARNDRLQSELDRASRKGPAR